MKVTRRTAQARARRRMPLTPLLLAAVVLHVYLVYSIVAQPLNVNRHPASSRSAIWPLHNDTVHRIGPAVDFFAVYHAGTVLSQGGNPYAYELGSQVTLYFFPYRYLPVVAQTLGVLLQTFPPRVAYWVWVAVMESLLAILIVLLYRRLPTPAWRLFAAYVLLLSSPYFLEVHLGQFTFVSLALLAIAVLVMERPGPARRRGATFIAAACYTASVALKVLPLVAAPAFLRRRYVWLLILSVVIVLSVTIPYFAAHTDQWRRFSELNLSKSPEGLVCGNVGLVYLTYLLATDVSGRDLRDSWTIVSTVLQVIVLGATALIVLLTRHPSVEVALGALITGHMLTYVDVWEHHFSGVLIIALLVLVWMSRPDAPAKNRALTALTTVAVVLIAIPTPFVFFDNGDPRVWDPSVDWPAYQRLLVLLPKVLATLCLYAVCVVELVRAGWKRPSIRLSSRR